MIVAWHLMDPKAWSARMLSLIDFTADERQNLVNSEKQSYFHVKWDPGPWIIILFFCLFITRMRPMEIMARVYTVRFLSAVRAVAARYKHPFALRPGLSHEDVMRTKGITKEKERSERNGPRKEHRKAPPNPLLRTWSLDVAVAFASP